MRLRAWEDWSGTRDRAVVPALLGVPLPLLLLPPPPPSNPPLFAETNLLRECMPTTGVVTAAAAAAAAAAGNRPASLPPIVVLLLLLSLFPPACTGWYVYVRRLGEVRASRRILEYEFGGVWIEFEKELRCGVTW